MQIGIRRPAVNKREMVGPVNHYEEIKANDVRNEAAFHDQIDARLKFAKLAHEKGLLHIDGPQSQLV